MSKTLEVILISQVHLTVMLLYGTGRSHSVTTVVINIHVMASKIKWEAYIITTWLFPYHKEEAVEQVRCFPIITSTSTLVRH